LEYYYNPACGLDIDETCDEKTWVDCRLASRRLGNYGFAFFVIVVLIIMYFVGSSRETLIAASIIAALLLAAAYLGNMFMATLYRTEYKRFENEIGGIMRQGHDRSSAIRMRRDEVLSRERNAALMQSNRGVGTGVGMGVGASLGNSLINNLFKK
jgi:cell division protein FtsW (lipid II flippase)